MKVFQALVFLVALSTAAHTSSSSSVPVLYGEVFETIKSRGSVDVVISFRTADVKGVRARVRAEAAQNGGDRTQRIQRLYTALKSHADETQKDVLDMLKADMKTTTGGSAIKIFPLWITNQIGVKGAKESTIRALMRREDVLEIAQTYETSELGPARIQRTTALPQAQVQWGIEKIEVPALWEQGYRGNGVVVGSMDSGVNGEHEALQEGHRELNGWYDPDNSTNKDPFDDHGHGSHTMGIIAGRTRGIGVAPEAQWISCKALNRELFGEEINLKACGQFFVCPTEADGLSSPRCDLAPHVVSNSWSFPYSSNISGFYDDILETWRDAGILPVFSGMNKGEVCGSIGFPADSDLVITVGASDRDDTLADFSSKGPTVNSAIKPDLLAPGVDIVSCDKESRAGYVLMDGTNMAAPHVAGLIALLLQKRPGMTIEQVRSALYKGARTTIVPIAEHAADCAGTSDVHPNNYFGYGRVSAKASFYELDNIEDNK